MTTIESLRKQKTAQNKITCLTAYDASFASLMHDNGVEVLLVGDSLGNVVQGQETTLPVTVDEMIYHAKAVKRGAPEAFIVVDMPFMSYSSVDVALQNAGRIMKETGAQMVKLEGGQSVLAMVNALSAQGIPVCAHLGLLPQSVHKKSGYKVQGKAEKDAEQILQDAMALEQAGADMLVLECVPAMLAKRITEAVTMPVIGIGAGRDCDGQVLVCYDMLDLTKGKRPKFSKNY
ncbi:MAG: 3-methyl-2-oxobutanoate hydroxymethyltransferase, partial [Gammaproteobacteria bacterium]|nr:3-methyl-2-oxobutanoate hydroxymethyltransferase [Gammaproteobacteria bacterium]